MLFLSQTCEAWKELYLVFIFLSCLFPPFSNFTHTITQVPFPVCRYFFYPYEQHMNQCTQLCLSGWREGGLSRECSKRRREVVYTHSLFLSLFFHLCLDVAQCSNIRVMTQIFISTGHWHILACKTIYLIAHTVEIFKTRRINRNELSTV